MASRGKPKPKLRDYSHLELSPEERAAISDIAVSTDQHSIVVAILGYVLVEHELDYWLRRRFKRNDKKMWEKLLDERGPLRSFAAKITIGHAFGIYDAKVEHDLNIVRTIRNAFAHSKKLLDFDDKLLVPELLSAHCLDMKLKKELQKNPTIQLGKVAYILICLKLQNWFLKKKTRAAKQFSYRYRRKLLKTSPVG